jgi:DNA (cytosine-5)-methyltransferase 1
MKTFASLFSGGGGSDCGAVAAGYTPVCAVEYDPYAAALYRQNFGDHVREESILDTPIEKLLSVEFLWASPPCPSFSTAKTDGKETELDIALAQKTADIIKAINPRYFALENVRGYVGSESFRIIYATLETMGYNLHHAIYDAASFGVPQNRNRLILRASRDRLRLLQPTHAKVPDLFHQPWNGWYDAVADLLPSCKPTHLTEKQIQSLEKKGWYGEVEKALAVSSEYLEQNGKAGRCQDLPIGTVTTQSKPLAVLVEGNKNPSRVAYTRLSTDPAQTVCASATSSTHLPRAVLVEGKDSPSRDRTLRNAHEPCMTGTANQGRGGRSPKAVILERVGYPTKRGPTVRESDEPIWTVRSHVGCDERHGYRSPVTALLEGAGAEVRALDYRCLSRFQSFPAWYQWGASKGKNCRVIGNAVPPLLAQKVVESFR